MTYESKATGATRQAYVYTPPDYNRTTTKYPVFYLLHGGGDLDPGLGHDRARRTSSWTICSRRRRRCR